MEAESLANMCAAPRVGVAVPAWAFEKKRELSRARVRIEGEIINRVLERERRRIR